MAKWTSSTGEWLPAVFAVFAVILTAGYAVSRKVHAAEGIDRIGGLGATLTDAARDLQDGTMSGAEIEELTAMEEDLQGRMADALKPSLVQAELVQSAGGAGVVFREFRPLPAPRRSSGGDRPAAYPRYQVLVSGTYRQIAEYMQLCCRQRLPVRVTEFHLRRVSEKEGARRREGTALGNRQSTRLTADITVEAFLPGGKVEGVGNGR